MKRLVALICVFAVVGLTGCSSAPAETPISTMPAIATLPPAVELVEENLGVELLANGTFDEADGDNPLGWATSHWGENKASFSYGADGATVEMTEITNGDGKWQFDNVAVVAGAAYKYQNKYKATTESRVVAELSGEDGGREFLELDRAAASADFADYSDTFIVPDGMSVATVYHLLDSVGILTVDSVSLTRVSVKFDRALLSITFDDGWWENVVTALPLLDKYGLKSTHFYLSLKLESLEMVEGVLALDASGHEIGSHTVHHSDLTTLSETALRYELENFTLYLEEVLGKPVNSFASPFGQYNTEVIDAVDDLYSSHRTVEEGCNLRANTDVYAVKARNVYKTTTAAEIAQWIEEARQGRFWLVLLYHEISDDASEYGTAPQVFEEHLVEIVRSGITVKTYADALDEVRPQLN